MVRLIIALEDNFPTQISRRFYEGRPLKALNLFT